MTIAMVDDGDGRWRRGGAGVGRWPCQALPFWRPLRMRAEHQNLGGPLTFGPPLESSFFCKGPQIPGPGLILGARLELLLQGRRVHRAVRGKPPRDAGGRRRVESCTRSPRNSWDDQAERRRRRTVQRRQTRPVSSSFGTLI
jgi:hypothetical protein